MTSAHQVAANRQNAQKSTGPTTENGKALASQNARRHGLTAAPDEADVLQWLCIVLNSERPPSPLSIATDEGVRRAYRLAAAEARLALLRRSLDRETMPLELGDPDQHKFEEIRKEIQGFLKEPWKHGNSVDEAMLKFEQLSDLHCAHEDYVKLSARYLREAHSARNRAFRDWLQWQRGRIS